MKFLKDLTKQIFLSSTSLMIIFTLTLYTYPAQVVYAQDSDSSTTTGTETESAANCEKDSENEDGSAGVYKPGCKFNDALTKANESPEGDGIKGMIEQYVGIAMAAVALSSIMFQYTIRSTLDCPQNNNAQITLRLMQGGGLALMLGEMKAKTQFKKASKLASDQAFAPKPKADESVKDKEAKQDAIEANNNQIAAYDTLEKIYDYKIKGIKTKINLATVAELTYLGAMGTEIGMVASEKAICSEGSVNKVTIEKSQVAAVETLVAEVQASAVAMATTCAECVSACVEPCRQAAACEAAVLEIQGLGAYQIGSDSGRDALGAVNAETEYAKSVEEGGFLTSIMSAITGIFSGGSDKAAEGVKQVVDVQTKALETAEGIEIATESSETAADESASKTKMSTDKTTWTTTVSSSSTCLAATPLAGLATKEFTGKEKPNHCCGGDIVAGVANAYLAVPSPPGVMDVKRDIIIAPIPVIGKNTIDFIKPAILNTIAQTYMEKHKDHFQITDPVKALARHKAFYDYMSVLEKDFDKEILNHPDVKKYDAILAGKLTNPDFDIIEEIEKMKLELISDANAIEFKDVLGFGIKLILVTKLLGTFFRTKALNKPRNRIWTFGIMAALNAAIIIFTKKKLDENEEFRDVIIEEREKFARSHAIKTNVDGGDSEDGDQDNPEVDEDLYGEGADTSGELACAVPSEGGFKPATCPAKQPDSGTLNVRSNPVTAGGIPPLINGLPALVNDAVTAAASGQEGNNPDAYNASLKALNDKSGAIRKSASGLLKNFDNKTPFVKDKNGKKRKFSVGKSIAGISKSIRNANGANGVSGGGIFAPSPLAKGDDKDKKDGEEIGTGGKVAAVPKFGIPKSGSSGAMNFDFGDGDESGINLDEEAGSDTEIAKYDLVNNGDIIDNSGVNIFQVISNRYLRSYPVLLEEMPGAKDDSKSGNGAAGE